MSAYTVETVEGCRIIRGNVPLRDVVDLLKQAGDTDQVDTELAQQLDAGMVFGPPDALRRLWAKTAPR